MQYSFLNLLFQCSWYGEVVSLHRWLLRQGPLYNCTATTQDVIELCENAVVYIYNYHTWCAWAGENMILQITVTLE